MLHERKNKERVSILKGINKKTYHVLVHSQLVVPFQQFYFWMYWCWRRHLRVPWTARRSNQSILKEISPEYSCEGLMLKLKLPYFGHLMRRTDSLEKTLMLGKIKGRRRGGWQRRRWLEGITDWMGMSLSSSRRDCRCAAVHGVSKSQTWLSSWTGLKSNVLLISFSKRGCLWEGCWDGTRSMRGQSPPGL